MRRCERGGVLALRHDAMTIRTIDDERIGRSVTGHRKREAVFEPVGSASTASAAKATAAGISLGVAVIDCPAGQALLARSFHAVDTTWTLESRSVADRARLTPTYG